MTLTLAAAGTIQGVAGSATAITYSIFGDEITAGPTNTFKVLAQGQLAASVAAIYTVGGSTSAIVKNIQLVNTTGAGVTVTMYINGTAAGNSIGAFTVPANGQAVWSSNGGWTLRDSAGATITTSSSTGTPTTRLLNTTAPLTGGGDLSADRTLAISAATTTTAGSLSAADKKKLNNAWFDVTTDFGLVGDDATDNVTAWNTMITNVAANSTLFFPPGTYRFATEAAVPVDKHLNFEGAGERASILKSMSATANLINLNGTGGNAWYNTFTNLGFTSGVTKTAGAHLAITAAAAISIDLERLAFDNHFIGIDAQGAQAGNVSVWNNLNISAPAVNGRGIRINGSVINVVIANSTINGVPNAGAIAGSANIEINQSGAVQIIGCDLIGAINSLLINANQGGGTSVAAIYVTNTFFDQSGGSTIKITGANTSDRIKFTQCGIAAGLIGTNAFEVAGTGAGAVGSATAMPAGISLVDCDIYYAPGSSTASGILVNGCQDINIQDTRIAGFSGTGGAGLHVIPSAANQTRVRANGCRIGPNSNLTINNLVGVQLDAGSSALGALTITDNDLGGNGTAIVDNSTIVATNSKMINNNVGALSGMSSSLASAAGFALSATEQVAVILPLPANSAKVGTTFKFTITGTAIATVTTTARLHIGTAGSVADAQIVTTAASAVGVAGGFLVTGLVTITAVGASGTGQGAILITTGTTTGAPAITATGTFNSTIANFVTVGLLCSAAGHTVRAATLEIVSPA